MSDGKRNRISIAGGSSRGNPTEELSQESWWTESARGSIVLTGTVESYDGGTRIAYVNHRSGETVKALNMTGGGLTNGDIVTYLLDDTGEYSVIGIRP